MLSRLPNAGRTVSLQANVYRPSPNRVNGTHLFIINWSMFSCPPNVTTQDQRIRVRPQCLEKYVRIDLGSLCIPWMMNERANKWMRSHLAFPWSYNWPFLSGMQSFFQLKQADCWLCIWLPFPFPCGFSSASLFTRLHCSLVPTASSLAQEASSHISRCWNSPLPLSPSFCEYLFWCDIFLPFKFTCIPYLQILHIFVCLFSLDHLLLSWERRNKLLSFSKCWAPRGSRTQHKH